MEFEIGDKVLTTAGLYMNGEWRDRGVKGKIVDISDSYGGLLTVKFKGMDDLRFIRPEYLILRSKKKRPFKVGDTVSLKDYVNTNGGSFAPGADAEVVGVLPDSNLVQIKFLSGTELTVAEEVLSKTEVVADEQADPDFEEDSRSDEKETDEHSPEVVEALQQILARIEEIKHLLTSNQRRHVVTVYANTSKESFVTPEEEAPAPEPVFKKAKEVKTGDSLYTEAGVWDKVSRIETKDSGYTSLYGTFGNKIIQVPSGRVVQVLEEVS